MNNLQLTEAPVARAAMLIRKPVAQVFEAFIDPAIIELKAIEDAFPKGL